MAPTERKFWSVWQQPPVGRKAAEGIDGGFGGSERRQTGGYYAAISVACLNPTTVYQVVTHNR